MKKIFMFLLVSVVGYTSYFFLVLKPISSKAQHDMGISSGKKNDGILSAIVPNQESIQQTTGSSSTNRVGASINNSPSQVGITQYQGMGFPTQSAYLKAPSQSGSGLITIDNGYSDTNLLVEFQHEQQIIAVAYVKKGERFSAKHLPAGKLSLIVRDLSNSQTTTTRGFDTAEAVKVTPYLSAIGQGSAVMLYRAEAQAKP